MQVFHYHLLSLLWMKCEKRRTNCSRSWCLQELLISEGSLCLKHMVKNCVSKTTSFCLWWVLETFSFLTRHSRDKTLNVHLKEFLHCKHVGLSRSFTLTLLSSLTWKAIFVSRNSRHISLIFETKRTLGSLVLPSYRSRSFSFSCLSILLWLLSTLEDSVVWVTSGFLACLSNKAFCYRFLLFLSHLMLSRQQSNARSVFDTTIMGYQESGIPFLVSSSRKRIEKQEIRNVLFVGIAL